jgi:YD repeat-containing protein
MIRNTERSHKREAEATMCATLRCEWWSQGLSALLTTAAIVLACLGVFPGLAVDISYVYDAAGRLRAVIDPASDTVVYAYDAVGNLTGITRQPSSTLAVLQFTPSSSPVGATVTIYGTGFSVTPASNTVKFNGTTPTVLTASTMEGGRIAHPVVRHSGSESPSSCRPASMHGGQSPHVPKTTIGRSAHL